MSPGDNCDRDAQSIEEGQAISPDPDFVCTRLFNAPRTLVYRAFTDADVLTRWWGPEGFANTFEEFTPRAGGTWRFVMRDPDGRDHRMLNEFVEVEHERKIVLQHRQAGHNFRLEMTYADEADKTRLTWRIWFESAEEAERVRPFLNRANEQNFDRLEAQLTALR
jgi:uncharacterized protein YndB with AHSA1/START domain